jgi:hypothetical protein
MVEGQTAVFSFILSIICLDEYLELTFCFNTGAVRLYNFLQHSHKVIVVISILYLS